jgi:hypothetical protein
MYICNAVTRSKTFICILLLQTKAQSTEAVTITPTSKQAMSPLDARKKSFMLLPDLYHEPGKDVTLGRVFPFDGDLNDALCPTAPYSFRLVVDDDRIESAIISRTEINIDDMDKKSGWATAAISCLTGVGGGIKGERQKTSLLRVSSERITRTIFRPTQEDIRKVLADEDVFRTLGLRRRPVVYLITGLMIAHSAHVEDYSGQQHGGAIHADVDLSAAQVPVNLGSGTDWSKSLNQSIGYDIERDFILAYQLVRLQRRVFGDVKDIKARPENRCALFDNTRSQVPIYLHDYLEDGVLEKLQ